jgi:hypothetical protein
MSAGGGSSDCTIAMLEIKIASAAAASGPIYPVSQYGSLH